ncbi:MAG TPA: polysaccharide biosynthesis/export family protein, partial [Terriglobales bacterium]|nr:polysaccharide biosynthesis/export family protein [Terriglobales bacterium]
MRFQRPMIKLRYSLGLPFLLLPLVFLIPSLAQEPVTHPPSVTDKASQASQDPATPSSPDSSKSAEPSLPKNSDLRLGAGDLIELSVYNVPELSTKTRVGSNGDVYLPLVDYVHVGGLTLQEAQSLLEKRYSDGGYLKDPHITLFVDEYASQGASLLGEVAKPGVYPVLGQQRLLDLVSSAGGFTDKAGRVVTITHRDEPDKPMTVTLSKNPSDNKESNVQVYPGDTITIHRADIVYVVGEVGKPSGFLMDSGSMTVLQAIALAGGVSRAAKLDGARIIRKTPQGMTETPVQ